MKGLIKYQDLNRFLNNYTRLIVWSGSEEDIINRWLNPIMWSAKEKSVFYGISTERDCGWYVEKEEFMNMIAENKPGVDCAERMLDEITDYLIDYEEPK